MNVQPVPIPIQPPALPTTAGADKVGCPFCGEEILRVARKCKHCNELLDPVLRQAGPAAGSPIQVNVQQVQGPTSPAPLIVHAGARQVSPGIAALLSFLWPGAGQLYVGKVGTGLVWMFATLFGYLLLILPGLIVHLFCIFAASQAAQRANLDAARQLTGGCPQ